MKIRLGWAIYNMLTEAPVRTGQKGHRMPKIYSTYKRARRYCELPEHVVVPVIIDPPDTLEVLNVRKELPAA